MPASSSEREESTARIPAEEERETQSTRPTNQTPSPEHDQEEPERLGSPGPNPSNPKTASDESNEAESSSAAGSGSDDPSTTSSEIRRRLGPLSDPRYILAESGWLGRIQPSKVAKILDRRHECVQVYRLLMEGFSKSDAEKRADTLKNAPTSKALAEKAASKKRSAPAGEVPPPKKSKGFTAKKKKPARPPPKMVINIPAEDSPPAGEATEERSLIPYSAAEPTEQPEALAQLDVFELKPDTSVDGSAFSGPVAKLVTQMPEAYKTASLSSGESYYSNFVRTLRVGGRPMSPSNRQTVVIPIKCTDPSPLSDKGKGKAEEAPAGSPVLSDDEASAAFTRMSPAKREKLKLELFKCFPEPYIKGLRGASSGHVGYMSQLAAETGICTASLSAKRTALTAKGDTASIGSKTISPSPSSLKPKTVQALVCVQDWRRAEGDIWSDSEVDITEDDEACDDIGDDIDETSLFL
ncbi:uncharacterized protein LOC130590290 [Beta vulgaris subsp. vulgaris]|uniref:uncharacterized protein LOC130590290 n=1 Tax=Beta vulgaris subsp. vulgaris TaxID=3555 RepID=UPI0025495DF6|nr:uncharacterized protein LOC130590290 [Beta vulgaris subsp. vulgaris]